MSLYIPLCALLNCRCCKTGVVGNCAMEHEFVDDCIDGFAYISLYNIKIIWNIQIWMCYLKHAIVTQTHFNFLGNWNISCDFAIENSTGPAWGQVYIGSGDSLLLSGNKPLPEPMVTELYCPSGITWPEWVKGLDIWRQVTIKCLCRLKSNNIANCTYSAIWATP